MQTSARYQAVFELISEIFKDKMPADILINQYLRARKYIGAKDRRFICDTTWDIIRHRMRLSFDAKSDNPREILLYYLKDEDFDIITGGKYGLEPVSIEEKKSLSELKGEEVYPLNVECECPLWLFEKIDCPALVRALNEKACVDIRANFISRNELKNRLKSEGLFFSLMPYAPFGLRSEDRLNLNNCVCYQEGLFDIQDESSQVAALLCDAKADEKIIDYCAGAGGKSLAMGAYLQNDGLILCHDVDFHRMDVIKGRAERLGIKNLKLIKDVEDTDFDRFVIDAPCSGTGTWRRSVDAKFRLNRERLAELNRTQLEILETAYRHTKIGAKIIYMTCSVLKDENQDIVEAFVQKHPDIIFDNHRALWDKKIDSRFVFDSEKYLCFSPLVTQTDGFFFCMMTKKGA